MSAHPALSRRNFLRVISTAALASPFFTRSLLSAPPNSTLQHATFGVTGMAGADLSQLSRHVKTIAAAEVDLPRSQEFSKKFPRAQVYQDWRELLDKEGKHLDIVNVSTPDHMHAPIAMSAMQLGIHVYVQKPMAHDLYEVRQLTEMAARKKLVTQMGIQIHSAAPYRTAVKLLQDGVIGRVKEVHSWCAKAWGDTAQKPPAPAVPPNGFDWNLWLGVCQERPFIPGYYHPSAWRKRVDFGTGTLGDMACHIFDPVFTGLRLGAPLQVTSHGPAPTLENWNLDSQIDYVFQGTRYCAGDTLPVSWYDGTVKPPSRIMALLEGDPLPSAGSILIGTEGTMLLPHYSRPLLYPDAKFQDYKFEMVPGGDHYEEFVKACKGEGQTSTPFSYSGPLTEAVLCGTVAMRFPDQPLAWNPARLSFSARETKDYIRRTYRRGWKVKGL